MESLVILCSGSMRGVFGIACRKKYAFRSSCQLFCGYIGTGSTAGPEGGGRSASTFYWDWKGHAERVDSEKYRFHCCASGNVSFIARPGRKDYPPVLVSSSIFLLLIWFCGGSENVVITLLGRVRRFVGVSLHFSVFLLIVFGLQ